MRFLRSTAPDRKSLTANGQGVLATDKILCDAAGLAEDPQLPDRQKRSAGTRPQHYCSHMRRLVFYSLAFAGLASGLAPFPAALVCPAAARHPHQGAILLNAYGGGATPWAVGGGAGSQARPAGQRVYADDFLRRP